MTPEQIRNLTDLRRLVHQVGAGTRDEVLARLRHNSEALSLTTRLRRSGLTDAQIATAMFEGGPADV
jgi:hypothetical protein